VACYPGLWNPALTTRGSAAVELWIQFQCGTCVGHTRSRLFGAWRSQSTTTAVLNFRFPVNWMGKAKRMLTNNETKSQAAVPSPGNSGTPLPSIRHPAY
jgi:hypothetical protein